MGERKVLNKYYPPDFDPSKILRRKSQPGKNQQTVRMMLPMGIRCNTCGSYIREGTKFNSRKEDVAGETYLGIQIFRFYIKCSNCKAEITFTTDPKNSDYTVEAGAKRMRDFKEEEVEEEEDDLGDTIKDLEKRRLKSKQEIDNLAAEHELVFLKSRQEKTTGDAYANALEVLHKEIEVDEEEKKAIVKAYIERRRAEEHVKKVIDDGDMLHVQKRSKTDGVQMQIGKSKASERGTCLGKIDVQKKKKPREDEQGPKLQSLFQQYGGDDIHDD